MSEPARKRRRTSPQPREGDRSHRSENMMGTSKKRKDADGDIVMANPRPPIHHSRHSHHSSEQPSSKPSSSIPSKPSSQTFPSHEAKEPSSEPHPKVDRSHPFFPAGSQESQFSPSQLPVSQGGASLKREIDALSISSSIHGTGSPNGCMNRSQILASESLSMDQVFDMVNERLDDSKKTFQFLEKYVRQKQDQAEKSLRQQLASLTSDHDDQLRIQRLEHQQQLTEADKAAKDTLRRFQETSEKARSNLQGQIAEQKKMIEIRDETIEDWRQKYAVLQKKHNSLMTRFEGIKSLFMSDQSPTSGMSETSAGGSATVDGPAPSTKSSSAGQPHSKKRRLSEI